MIKKSTIFLALVVFTGLTSLLIHYAVKTRGNYFPDATWRTSTPEKQGIDSEILAKLVTKISDEKIGVHSLLIIRNGYMVLDAYFHPFTPNTKHDVASVSKSITSALIGIAIDKGYIKNVNEKFSSFFQPEQIQNLTKEKQTITIKDLLTMTSGLHCDTSHGEVTLEQLLSSHDWLNFALNLPMDDAAGSHWVYNSPGVYLLSAILSRTSEMSLLNFAQHHLFYPLGIYDVAWKYDPQYRYNLGWGDLRMTPHDMAKIGYLYLHNGIWINKQIISSEWVKSTTEIHIKDADGENYGYLWWLSKDKKGLFYAQGRGGQFILVWPQENLVIVMTSAMKGSIAKDSIFPPIFNAIKSNDPLPINDKGYQSLTRALEKAQQAELPRVIKTETLPAMAKIISGKTFLNQETKFKFSLTFVNTYTVILKEVLPTLNIVIEFYFNTMNKPQKYLGMYCIPGIISGYWASETTFVFDKDEIGNNRNYHVEITFKNHGQKATVQVKEKTTNSEKTFDADAID